MMQKHDVTASFSCVFGKEKRNDNLTFFLGLFLSANMKGFFLVQMDENCFRAVDDGGSLL